MKISFVLLLLSCLPLRAEIIGLWNTENDESQIEIGFDADSKTYHGKLVAISDKVGDPDVVKTDHNNPDASKRDVPLIGLTLMEGFKQSGKDKYTGGTIYDPKSGKTYKCKVTQTNDDTISVRGFIGISLVGKSTTWTRAKP